MLLAAAGCRSASSSYDYLDSWVIREDAARPFAIPADVIYVQGELYTDLARLPKMTSYARGEVGKGRFAGLARVFSPLIATPEDVENAVEWYFRHHHDGKRFFVFIGEGEGGALLKAYEEEDSEELREKGLVASFYTDESQKGFVTDEMVKKMRYDLIRARYLRQWGREMPEEMLKE